MKNINLKGSWVIKAPIDQVFKIISDFENMPNNFPTVAESLVITKRDGNKLEIDAKAKSFGVVFPVKMKTEIIPRVGYISLNENSKLGISGHEEFLMEETEEGTRINYVYSGADCQCTKGRSRQRHDRNTGRTGKDHRRSVRAL
jgi:carbon monoxide dehydrogenase subunit G